MAQTGTYILAVHFADAPFSLPPLCEVSISSQSASRTGAERGWTGSSGAADCRPPSFEVPVAVTGAELPTLLQCRLLSAPCALQTQNLLGIRLAWANSTETLERIYQDEHQRVLLHFRFNRGQWEIVGASMQPFADEDSLHLSAMDTVLSSTPAMSSCCSSTALSVFADLGMLDTACMGSSEAASEISRVVRAALPAQRVATPLLLVSHEHEWLLSMMEEWAALAEKSPAELRSLYASAANEEERDLVLTLERMCRDFQRRHAILENCCAQSCHGGGPCTPVAEAANSGDGGGGSEADEERQLVLRAAKLLDVLLPCVLATTDIDGDSRLSNAPAAATSPRAQLLQADGHALDDVSNSLHPLAAADSTATSEPSPSLDEHARPASPVPASSRTPGPDAPSAFASPHSSQTSWRGSQPRGDSQAASRAESASTVRDVAVLPDTAHVPDAATLSDAGTAADTAFSSAAVCCASLAARYSSDQQDLSHRLSRTSELSMPSTRLAASGVCHKQASQLPAVPPSTPFSMPRPPPLPVPLASFAPSSAPPLAPPCVKLERPVDSPTVSVTPAVRKAACGGSQHRGAPSVTRVGQKVAPRVAPNVALSSPMQHVSISMLDADLSCSDDDDDPEQRAAAPTPSLTREELRFPPQHALAQPHAQQSGARYISNVQAISADVSGTRQGIAAAQSASSERPRREPCTPPAEQRHASRNQCGSNATNALAQGPGLQAPFPSPAALPLPGNISPTARAFKSSPAPLQPTSQSPPYLQSNTRPSDLVHATRHSGEQWSSVSKSLLDDALSDATDDECNEPKSIGAAAPRASARESASGCAQGADESELSPRPRSQHRSCDQRLSPEQAPAAFGRGAPAAFGRGGVNEAGAAQSQKQTLEPRKRHGRSLTLSQRVVWDADSGELGLARAREEVAAGVGQTASPGLGDSVHDQVARPACASALLPAVSGMGLSLLESDLSDDDDDKATDGPEKPQAEAAPQRSPPIELSQKRRTHADAWGADSPVSKLQRFPNLALNASPAAPKAEQPATSAPAPSAPSPSPYTGEAADKRSAMDAPHQPTPSPPPTASSREPWAHASRTEAFVPSTPAYQATENDEDTTSASASIYTRPGRRKLSLSQNRRVRVVSDDLRSNETSGYACVTPGGFYAPAAAHAPATASSGTASGRPLEAGELAARSTSPVLLDSDLPDDSADHGAVGVEVPRPVRPGLSSSDGAAAVASRQRQPEVSIRRESNASMRQESKACAFGGPVQARPERPRMKPVPIMLSSPAPSPSASQASASQTSESDMFIEDEALSKAPGMSTTLHTVAAVAPTSSLVAAAASTSAADSHHAAAATAAAAHVGACSATLPASSAPARKPCSAPTLSARTKDAHLTFNCVSGGRRDTDAGLIGREQRGEGSLDNPCTREQTARVVLQPGAYGLDCFGGETPPRSCDRQWRGSESARIRSCRAGGESSGMTIDGKTPRRSPGATVQKKGRKRLIASDSETDEGAESSSLGKPPTEAAGANGSARSCCASLSQSPAAAWSGVAVKDTGVGAGDCVDDTTLLPCEQCGGLVLAARLSAHQAHCVSRPNAHTGDTAAVFSLVDDVVDRVPCEVCGCSQPLERLEQHQKICAAHYMSSIPPSRGTVKPSTREEQRARNRATEPAAQHASCASDVRKQSFKDLHALSHPPTFSIELEDDIEEDTSDEEDLTRPVAPASRQRSMQQPLPNLSPNSERAPPCDDRSEAHRFPHFTSIASLRHHGIYAAVDYSAQFSGDNSQRSKGAPRSRGASFEASSSSAGASWLGSAGGKKKAKKRVEGKKRTGWSTRNGRKFFKEDSGRLLSGQAAYKASRKVKKK